MTTHREQPETPGSDIVLLHGWGWHAGVWDEVAAALAPGHRVWAPDLPGHGQRGAQADGMTLAQLVAALAAQAPAAATWVGWSLGALIALAAARAGIARRVVLLAGTPCFVQRADWAHGVTPAWFEDFTAALERDPPAALRRFAALHLDADAPRTLLRRLRAEAARHRPAPAALRAGLALLQAADLRAALAEIAAPALVVHGAGDRLVPPAAGEFLAQALARARFLCLAQAGHALPLSHAAALAQSIGEFCRE